MSAEAYNAQVEPRSRTAGRIAGFAGIADSRLTNTLAATLANALGCDALLLRESGETDIVADWDCCSVDGQSINALDDWRTIIKGNRLAHIEGAFSVAWRENDGSLFIARDGLGERSLFYALVGGGVVFSSTLRSLVETRLVPRDLNLPAVAAYLSYAYIPGAETLIAGIHKLLPGEIICFRQGRITRSQFWSLPAEDCSQPRSEPELRDLLRTRLEQAVLRRLPPSQTVGAFLSGGLDSSLVVALARKLHQHPVITYSVSFGPGHPNELQFSSIVADHCATIHRVLELTPGTVEAQLDRTVALLNDPIGDPLTVPNALLFREASAEVGVVLNGEGGDPCFGGPKNLPMLLAELLGDGSNSGADESAYRRERTYLRAHQKCYDDLEAMLNPDIRATIADGRLESAVTAYFEDPRWSRFVTKLMAINVTFKGAHHILPKVDSISAEFGVAARSPLFDRSVVDIAFAIPPQLKLRGSVEKYLLKEAVKDLLPQAIVERPKSGMLVPVEGWFQGPLLSKARERLLDGLRPHTLFQTGYLERLLAGRLGGHRPRRGAKIWLLITLEAWLRSVFR